jgi:hypothetical protein
VMGQVERQQMLIDEVNEREAPDGATALAMLQAIYRNKLIPLSVRMRAASLALPFESPRLAVTAHVTEDDFAARLERAIVRSGIISKLIEAEAVDPDGRQTP